MGENKKKAAAADKVNEQPATYDTYAALPDDGFRYEVIDGKLEMMSGPTVPHQVILRELYSVLERTCVSEYEILFAPLDVIFDNTNVLQPDLLMIHRSRLHIVAKRGIEGAPDLVAEVMSPSSRRKDKMAKRAVYEKFGVAEYWLIDGDSRTLEQYALVDGSYVLHNHYEADEEVASERLSCVSFRPSELFRSPSFM